MTREDFLATKKEHSLSLNQYTYSFQIYIETLQLVHNRPIGEFIVGLIWSVLY